MKRGKQVGKEKASLSARVNNTSSYFPGSNNRKSSSHHSFSWQSGKGRRDISATSSRLKFSEISFSPNVLFTNFAKGPIKEATTCVVEGAVLMVDISGFSTYASELSSQGMIGLETLQTVTNNFLGQFVDFIYQYRGDVLSFAGDALICLFPLQYGNKNDTQSLSSLQDACSRAIKCALEIVDLRSTSLATHIAITCGRVEVAILGGIDDNWVYLVNGKCMGELNSCITDAHEQEIVCTHACCVQVHSLFPYITFIEIEGTGNYCIEVNEDIDYTTQEYDKNRETKLAYERMSNFYDERWKASQFLSSVVKNSMISGYIKNSLSEMRNVTTMFISLTPIIYDIEQIIDMSSISPISFQPFFVFLQETLTNCGGYLRQFLFEDKGCVMILMWGLPSFTHTNNLERAIYCAHEILLNIKKYQYTASIGLSSGTCYCGIVGSPIRADYVAIGHTVNIAARLMSKAKQNILIDPRLYSELNNIQKQALMPSKSLQLKGITERVTPYTFHHTIEVFPFYIESQDTSNGHVILRVQAMNLLSKLLQNRYSLEVESCDNSINLVHDDSMLSLNETKEYSAIILSEQLEGSSGKSLGIPKNIIIPYPVIPLQDRSSIRRSAKITTTTISSCISASATAVINNSLKTNIVTNTTTTNTVTNNNVTNNTEMKLEDVTDDMLFTTGNVTSRRNSMMDDNISAKYTNKPSHTFILLTGAAGTGKRSDLIYFRQQVIKYNINIIDIRCTFYYHNTIYHFIRQLFWKTFDYLGKKAIEKRQFLIQLFEKLDIIRLLSPKEKLQSILQLDYILIEEDNKMTDIDLSIYEPLIISAVGMKTNDTNTTATMIDMNNPHNHVTLLLGVVPQQTVTGEEKGDKIESTSVISGKTTDAVTVSTVGTTLPDSKLDCTSDDTPGSLIKGISNISTNSTDYIHNYNYKYRSLMHSYHTTLHADNNNYSSSSSGVVSSSSKKIQGHYSTKHILQLLSEYSTTSTRSHQSNAQDSTNSHTPHITSFEECNDSYLPILTQYIIAMLNTKYLDIRSCALIEDAHFIDEYSWKILGLFKFYSLNCLLLMTLCDDRDRTDMLSSDKQPQCVQGLISHAMKSLTEQANHNNTTTTNTTNSTNNTLTQSHLQQVSGSLEGGPVNSRRSSHGSSNPYTNSSADSGSATSLNDGQIHHGHTRYMFEYETSQAFKSILTESSTIVIHHTYMTPRELNVTLSHIIGLEKISDDVIMDIYQTTSGHFEWCKEIGDYIKKEGIQHYLEHIDSDKWEDSLKHIIMAVLDNLTPETMMIVKKASVIGDAFAITILQSILSKEQNHHLEASILLLRYHGLIYCSQEFPLLIYSFHNKLTRKVLYNTLPPREAARTHREIAIYLEKTYADNLFPFYKCLSSHYSRCNDKKNIAFNYGLKQIQHLFQQDQYIECIEDIQFLKTLVTVTTECRSLHDIVINIMRKRKENDLKLVQSISASLDSEAEDLITTKEKRERIDGNESSISMKSIGSDGKMSRAGLTVISSPDTTYMQHLKSPLHVTKSKKIILTESKMIIEKCQELSRELRKLEKKYMIEESDVASFNSTLNTTTHHSKNNIPNVIQVRRKSSMRVGGTSQRLNTFTTQSGLNSLIVHPSPTDDTHPTFSSTRPPQTAENISSDNKNTPSKRGSVTSIYTSNIPQKQKFTIRRMMINILTCTCIYDVTKSIRRSSSTKVRPHSS